MMASQTDMTMRRLRNQWIKDRAILEQENHLLSLKLIDVKSRETSLKRSNNALVNSIDFGKGSSVTRLSVKLARLEEENKHLKIRLTETSVEKQKSEANELKLRIENASIKQRVSIQVREKKMIKDKYQKQLSKLEQEFEKLRYSNDHLMKAFRKSVISSKDEETPDRKRRNYRKKSHEDSDVMICQECIEDTHSQHTSPDLSQHILLSQVDSSSKQRLSHTNHARTSMPRFDIDSQLTSEVRRSVHNSKRDKGSFIDVFSINNSQARLKKASTGITAANDPRASITSNQRNNYQSFSRVLTESEYTSTVPMFKHKRKSTLGFLGLPNKQGHHDQRSHGTSEICNQIEFEVKDKKLLERGPLFLNTASLKSLTARGSGNPLSSLRRDYNDIVPRSSARHELKITEEAEDEKSFNPIMTYDEPRLNLEEVSCLQETPNHYKKLENSSKEQSRRSKVNKENMLDTSTRLSNSNIFRSIKAKDSAQDCLTFNNILKEKLANIEGKLRFKTAN